MGTFNITLIMKKLSLDISFLKICICSHVNSQHWIFQFSVLEYLDCSNKSHAMFLSRPCLVYASCMFTSRLFAAVHEQCACDHIQKRFVNIYIYVNIVYCDQVHENHYRMWLFFLTKINFDFKIFIRGVNLFKLLSTPI